MTTMTTILATHILLSLLSLLSIIPNLLFRSINKSSATDKHRNRLVKLLFTTNTKQKIFHTIHKAKPREQG